MAEAGQDVEGLPSGTWRLVDGVPLIEGYPITLSFGTDSASAAVGGKGGCNGYGSEIKYDGSEVSVVGISSTQVDCGDLVMSSEGAFFSALGAAEAFTVGSDGLSFSGPAGDLTFELLPPAPTSEIFGRRWVLVEVLKSGTAAEPIGAPATLVLEESGIITAGTGCRTITERWEEKNGEIFLSEMALDDGLCDEALYEQNWQVMAVVAGGSFIAEVDGKVLTLNANGITLVYRAEG